MTLSELNELVKSECFAPDQVQIVLDGTMGYCVPDVTVVSALISDEGLIERDEGQEETPVKQRRKVILIS